MSVNGNNFYTINNNLSTIGNNNNKNADILNSNNNNNNNNNDEEVWEVNLNNLYTKANTRRLLNLNLKKRFAERANAFPELRNEFHENVVKQLRNENAQAMKMFNKKRRSVRRRRAMRGTRRN